MGIVNLHDKIRDDELQLMHPQPPRLRLRRQTVPRSEIEQDIGGLPDHEFSGFKKRRRERRPAAATLHHPHHRGHAAIAARDVGITGAGILQREADIFAAALNARPVVEFVAHGAPELDSRTVAT